MERGDKQFKTIKCPKCGADVQINIANAVDEEGEVFACPECMYKMRYTEIVCPKLA